MKDIVMKIIGSPKFFPAVLILLDVLADGRTRKGGEKTEICQSVYRKNTERGDTQLRGAEAAVQNGKADI